MVEPTNANLSIRVQCRLLSISQSDWYYDPKGPDPLSLKIMGLIDKQLCRHLIMVVARWLVTLAGWVIVLGGHYLYPYQTEFFIPGGHHGLV